MLALGLLVTALHLAPPYAGAEEGVQLDLEKGMTEAKTPAQHTTMASYYDRAAATAHAKAAEARTLAATYRDLAMTGRSAFQIGDHYRQLGPYYLNVAPTEPWSPCKPYKIRLPRHQASARAWRSSSV
jgi:hypothetical protein